jgi:hypothetical protein
MSNTNTGGPAFPTPKFDLNEAGQLTSFSVDTDGMTLRDYFATKAMQGICASGPSHEWSNSRLAAEAYDLADAMLKAREA